MHQDVGSNPAAARNENTDFGQTPAEKVPKNLAGSKWKTGDVSRTRPVRKKKKILLWTPRVSSDARIADYPGSDYSGMSNIVSIPVRI